MTLSQRLKNKQTDKKNPQNKTDRTAVLAADPQPAVQEGALSDSRISFGFIYILCQKLWPPGCQTPRSHGGGVREQRRPLLLQNHRQDLPVLAGAGIGSHSRHSESTGRHWRSTNTAAYSRRPERTGALSFKTFPCSATFAPGVEDTAALSWLDHRGQTSTKA